MKLIACIITIVAIGSAEQVRAGVYPTNQCVSAKMAAASAYCQSALKAWSSWDKNQNTASRDTALSKAATKLGTSWAAAEKPATAKGVDCAQTTLSLPDLRALVDGAVTDVVTAINGGLTLSDKGDAKCGSNLLSAAAKQCAGLLKAEAKYIKALANDPTGAARGTAKTKATQAFSDAWDKATAGTCHTSGTKAGVGTSLDNLNDQVVTDTTVSPTVDDSQFTTITPANPTSYLGKSLEPVCMDGSSPYAFYAKRGSVNKLLMYYQGGGACWEQLTCGAPTCTTKVPSGNYPVYDPTMWPTGLAGGFGDLTNPDNPFKDWNIVFVPYCSCDLHFGDAVQDYTNIDPAHPVHVVHHGFHNAKVAEKWAREHFVNPDMVFVSGSSGGAYGAAFNAPLLHGVWPASRFGVLTDAGSGVMTTSFLADYFPNWNFSAHLPKYIPGVTESLSGANPTGAVGYDKAVAAYFPRSKWAVYSTAFDGPGGGQTGFYNIMLNGNNPLAAVTWWNGSCAFNAKIVQQAHDTYDVIHATTADNFRYYIGSGSRHTMWVDNKVYSDTLGGVPLLVDWVNSMLAGDSGWTNVEASPENVLLPGDPIPTGACSNNGSSCRFNTDCGSANTCSAPNPFESSDGGKTVTVNCP